MLPSTYIKDKSAFFGLLAVFCIFIFIIYSFQEFYQTRSLAFSLEISKLKNEAETFKQKYSACQDSLALKSVETNGDENTLAFNSSIEDSKIADEGTEILVTMVTEDGMKSLRDLVGSLHGLRHSNLDVHPLIVYGFNLTEKSKGEINIWRNVELIDGDKTLLFAGHQVLPPTKQESLTSSPDNSALFPQISRLIVGIIELNLRKYSRVLFINNRFAFKIDSIHQISGILNQRNYIFVSGEEPYNEATNFHDNYDKFALIGFKAESKPALLMISFQLQCIRGYHCDPAFQKQLAASQRDLMESPHNKRKYAEMGLKKFEKPSSYCFILLRDDILYSLFPPEDSQQSGSEKLNESPLDPFPPTISGKIPIAIGMPTLSVNTLQSFEETAPIRVFVPSLLETVTRDEWKKFEYRVYIGFDDGDKYFDSEEYQPKIRSALDQLVRTYREKHNFEADEKTDLKFYIVRFPYSKGWVTYIWNGLFVKAINDGAHYYYQVNDDLRLKSSKWTTYFVDALTQNDQIGVAGPWDNRHGGSLLTQAFVSRKHYYIFGRLYPLDIKDWFSDNWLNDVYGKSNRFSIQSVSADNLNDKGTRYSICGSQPRYKELLKRGQSIFEDWMKDFEEIKKAADDSGDSEQSKRLEREIEYGNLI